MSFTVQDYYFKKAREEGYRARSAYKLKMIQQKYQIIQTGDRVLDMGAAPGGWMQVALALIGQYGIVVGVDLIAISKFHDARAHTIIGNLMDKKIQEPLLALAPFDVVLSDLAPRTTGSKLTDQMRSLELARMVLEQSRRLLKKRGNLVIKIFESNDAKDLVKAIKQEYQRVELYKPKASRQESFEVYIIAQQKVDDIIK